MIIAESKKCDFACKPSEKLYSSHNHPPLTWIILNRWLSLVCFFWLVQLLVRLIRHFFLFWLTSIFKLKQRKTKRSAGLSYHWRCCQCFFCLGYNLQIHGHEWNGWSDTSWWYFNRRQLLSMVLSKGNSES